MAQAPGMAQPNNPAQMVQNNLQLRSALLQTAPRMRKKLGAFTGAPGGTTRVKLFNVGITTKMVILVELPVTIAVAAATLSPKAPYNLIDRIRLQDYDGTDRVNVSGFQLWMINSVRRQTAAGIDVAGPIFTQPQAPVAIGAQTIRFLIEVPICYDDRRDLRGALLTQTAVGEAFLNIDWNPTLVQDGNADAVYNGGATTTVVTAGSITATVTQEYLLPQAVGGSVPMPMLDLLTVYELAGAVRSSDNINASSEKLFNYPNLRSVIGSYYNFVNGGVMSAANADIAGFRLIANGNNVLREYGPYEKMYDQRLSMITNTDLRPGAYFELHREKPIETALFGNVQMGITPSSVSAGNTNFEVAYESFYTKGSQLPGIQQS